jgi:hypothetical protein
MSLHKQPLTIPQILEWADDHHARFGHGSKGGPVFSSPRSQELNRLKMAP